jgi:hypothetical protein
MTKRYDVRLYVGGSIVLFAPLSRVATEWCEEHLPDDCPMLGDQYAVEARYAYDIVEGMMRDGLRLASRVGGAP